MPTKERVREWQQERRTQHTPPPSPEQIKRELGWDLVKAAQQQRKSSDVG
jgi:hypothetical protein